MDVNVLKVYDSRGASTIHTYTYINGCRIDAFAPSGKSTGIHEVTTFALENGKPNAEKSIEFFGKNKSKINSLFDNEEQESFDKGLKELDGSDNFANMGGSVSIALSSLFLKVNAFRNGKEVFEFLNPNAKVEKLPKFLGNALGGGLHSTDSMPIQELLITHTDASSTECVKRNIDVYNEMKSLLKKRNQFFAKGDEGAIDTNISFNDALYLIEEARHNLGYETKIGMDVAANSFYKDGNYYFENKVFNEDEFKDYLIGILDKFKNIIYIEDPFYEESFDAFAELQKETDAYICGDDLYTTNVKRIREGLEKNATTAVLIKPNQIGTITDTYNAVKLAKENNQKTIVSHRSGETCDSLITHLAVGWETDFMKPGIVSGERIAKANELLYIERKLRNN